MFTHHLPTFLNYPEHYKGDVLNEAFALELFDLIDSSNIDYWVYGHHHCNIPEFNIGKTRLVTNQLGYVQQYEHELLKQINVLSYDNSRITTYSKRSSESFVGE